MMHVLKDIWSSEGRSPWLNFHITLLQASTNQMLHFNEVLIIEICSADLIKYSISQSLQMNFGLYITLLEDS